MFKSDPKWDVLEKKEPFRCLVKFSSPHLLESLKSLAPAGKYSISVKRGEKSTVKHFNHFTFCLCIA